MKSFRHVHSLEPERANEWFRVQVTGIRWSFARPSYYAAGLPAWSLIHFHEPTDVHTPSGIIAMKAHTFMVFPPAVVMHVTAERRRTRQSWLRAVGAALPQWLRENTLSPFTAYSLESPVLCERWISALDDEMSRSRPDAGIIEHLFRAWLRDIRRTAGREHAVPNGIARARDHMRDHLAEQLTADSLAAEAGYSRAYFIELFTRHFGIPPMKYLMGLRMEYARYLLEDTGDPVGTIARHCGFTDIHHFSKAFKLHTGKSPRHHRAGKDR